MEHGQLLPRHDAHTSPKGTTHATLMGSGRIVDSVAEFRVVMPRQTGAVWCRGVPALIPRPWTARVYFVQQSAASSTWRAVTSGHIAAQRRRADEIAENASVHGRAFSLHMWVGVSPNAASLKRLNLT